VLADLLPVVSRNFLAILLEGMPFIFLGTLFSGFIDAYLPRQTIDRLLPKKPLPAILISGVLGLILPVCECAVVPVIRRLIGKGLPISCALTYMLAAPIVNPITALSTWKAFPQAPALFTSSRLLLGYAAAVLIGLLILRKPLSSILKDSALPKENEKESDHSHDHSSQKGDRLVLAMRSALRDFVDVGIYFTIGVIITALFKAHLDLGGGAQLIDTLSNNSFIGTAAAMILAFLLSLCSTSDAFIAANLRPLNYAAKMAFLTFGPLCDLKLIFLYQTVFRKKFVITLCLGLFIFCGTTALLWQHFLLPLFAR